MAFFLGIDIGGTGSRARLVRTDAKGESQVVRELAGDRQQVTAAGSVAPQIAADLLSGVADSVEPGELAGVVIGATGLGTLVADPAAFAADIAMHAVNCGVGNPRVAVAIDAVTAHAGALDGRAGAVVAAGTGVIAFGTDYESAWHRVDGWGHLVGDRGGGAWIGMRALSEAARAADGVSADGDALLSAIRDRLGDPLTWPAQLYTRDDRAGVMASLVPVVIECADAGDPSSEKILRHAGRELAATGIAAIRDGLPCRLATTGGIFGSQHVQQGFGERIAESSLPIEIVRAQGSGLDGAVTLAQRVSAESLRSHPGFVWAAGTIHSGRGRSNRTVRETRGKWPK